MSYRIAAVDVHKKMLAVVVADVATTYVALAGTGVKCLLATP
jgi:hypothetical protein